MDLNAMAVYCQSLAMTEPQLRDLRTWVYRQYGRSVMMLHICVIMLQWNVTQTADESFFLARWISAWSELSWVQLSATLQ